MFPSTLGTPWTPATLRTSCKQRSVPLNCHVSGSMISGTVEPHCSYLKAYLLALGTTFLRKVM